VLHKTSSLDLGASGVCLLRHREERVAALSGENRFFEKLATAHRLPLMKAKRLRKRPSYPCVPTVPAIHCYRTAMKKHCAASASPASPVPTSSMRASFLVIQVGAFKRITGRSLKRTIKWAIELGGYYSGVLE